MATTLGQNWTQLTTEAGFAARDALTLLVYSNGIIYVIGGWTSTILTIMMCGRLMAA